MAATNAESGQFLRTVHDSVVPGLYNPVRRLVFEEDLEAITWFHSPPLSGLWENLYVGGSTNAKFLGMALQDKINPMTALIEIHINWTTTD